MIEDFGLYLVITDPVAGYRAVTEAAVGAGIRFVQLRIKNTPHAEVLRIAFLMREITRGSQTRFIVNDDVYLAAECDADGVHLGQDDMPVEEARRFWGTRGKIFGLSTHNEEQARRAVAFNPDYIGIGPLFKTPTKAKPDPVLGLERAAGILAETPLPAVAIGGINESNLDEIRRAGFQNFAVVRAVCHAENPRDAIRRLEKR